MAVKTFIGISFRILVQLIDRPAKLIEAARIAQPRPCFVELRAGLVRLAGLQIRQSKLIV